MLTSYNSKLTVKTEISPWQAFQILYNGFGSFLLESPPTLGLLTRYSFIGLDPVKIITDSQNLWNNRLSPLAFGYLSYDLGWEIEKLPHFADDDLKLSKIMMIVPGKLLVFDRQRQELTITADNPQAILDRLSCGTIKPIAKKINNHNKINSNLTKHQFMTMVRRAKEYIRAGDIYQVNLSQRFQVDLPADPLTVYSRLRQINPSPFASFFDFGEIKLVSCSPERLVKLENGWVEMRPIAGTRPINCPPQELLLDPKERAEHIMLVDLARNDLGKVCRPGSVKVDEMMVIEKYSHVQHIVSNVQGQLLAKKTAADVIRATFPGGTITGCPKVRAMEIIEELEPVKRGIYTGSIGYIGPDHLDLNIAIRTIVIKDQQAYVQAGAGIVADSDPEREFWETEHKAQAMLEALGI
ncbi:anthranilate synthase component I family protein [Candidatus Saganbacteria bacterium]|nr:anthranilate synthase component I family protein [Candidatus Saganbacteria bacterium]